MNGTFLERAPWARDRGVEVRMTSRELYEVSESPSQPQLRRKRFGVVHGAGALALCGGLLLTACGSPPSPNKAKSKNPEIAATEIRKNWVDFFSGKTSVNRRIALLQNGERFAQVMRAQSKQPFAKSAGAKVTKVKLLNANRATVTYTITVGGQPALSHQTGQAVRQNNVWKVGDSSFCALLSLEKVTAPGCPSPKG